MGKTLRWLKGLFGFKKESNSGDRKEKVPSCIGRSRRNPVTSPPVKHGYNNEQNRRAIEVAAATTAAADAAVAAAQAAVAFVRLTSQSRFVTTTTEDRQNSAAITIQAHFRGYLSKKALKALKSLVKLQALVRGFLVRKKTAETLHGMEALFRARSSVYAHKFRLQDDKFHSKRSLRASEGRSRRISSSYQIPNDGRPNLVDMEPNVSKSRLTRANTWAWAAESNARTPSPLFINQHRLSVPGFPNYYDYEPRFSTTHNTPRFAYSCGPNMDKSIYNDLSKDDSYTSDPNYMSKTESFRAKARSKSAPKQRPDCGGLGLKKRVNLLEVECGPIMEKSKSKSPSLLEMSSFKNCVMRKIGKSPKV